MYPISELARWSTLSTKMSLRSRDTVLSRMTTWSRGRKVLVYSITWLTDLLVACRPWDISWADSVGTDCDGADRRDSCDYCGTCRWGCDEPIVWRSSCILRTSARRSACRSSCRRTRYTRRSVGDDPCRSPTSDRHGATGRWRKWRQSAAGGVDCSAAGATPTARDDDVAVTTSTTPRRASEWSTGARLTLVTSDRSAAGAESRRRACQQYHIQDWPTTRTTGLQEDRESFHPTPTFSVFGATAPRRACTVAEQARTRINLLP